MSPTLYSDDQIVASDWIAPRGWAGRQPGEPTYAAEASWRASAMSRNVSKLFQLLVSLFNCREIEWRRAARRLPPTAETTDQASNPR